MKNWIIIQYDENACECGRGEAVVLWIEGPYTQIDAVRLASESQFSEAMELKDAQS